MIKVVLDTNVWISSFFGGAPRQIIALWAEGEIIIGLSQPIFEEYTRVMARMEFINSARYDEYLALLAEGRHVMYAPRTPTLHIVDADPDDNKFLECAVALGCDCVVSGDRHLLDIGQYLHIPILSPRAFLEMMGRQAR